MADSRTTLATDAWGSVLRVQAALVPRLDRALQGATDLPLSWYDVLLELAMAPDRRLRMSDLGERVTLSRTRVSRIVDELVSAGLVAREENPSDRRSAYATITRAGFRRLRDAAPVYIQAIGEQFAAPLTDAELRAVAKALNKVLAATSQTAGGAATR